MKKAIDIGNEMLKAEVRPLTKGEAAMLLKLLAVDIAGKQVDEVPDTVDFPLAYKILTSRAKWGGVDFTPNAAFFLSFVSSTPGEAVMYAAALKAVQTRAGGKVDLTTVIDRGFPMGVPTKEELHRIWDDQKVNLTPDNALDHSNSWS